jgi:hypothetical protein
MVIALCRLCEQQKELIRAHIIAQCLYEPLKHQSGPMLSISREPRGYPKASQTGEYDPSILCADCDNSFSPWDNYAREMLHHDLPKQAVRSGPTGQQFYVVGKYDYARLKLFFLSVLWRMSISSRDAFREVNLGPFKGQIRAMLLSKDARATEDFAVFVFRYMDQVGSSTVLQTRPERLFGRRVYNVGLPGYIGVVKVDRQPIPIPIGPLVLNPNGPLVIGLRDMQKSPEWPLVQRIFENQKRIRDMRRPRPFK